MKINVEVVYAGKDQQWILPLQMETGATVEQAVIQSGILAKCPKINLTQQNVGIFSKKVTLTTILHEGDRVEIYRPLIVDPKQRRKLRAKR